jgi:hypothetical protein
MNPAGYCEVVTERVRRTGVGCAHHPGFHIYYFNDGNGGMYACASHLARAVREVSDRDGNGSCVRVYPIRKRDSY